MHMDGFRGGAEEAAARPFFWDFFETNVYQMVF